MQKIISISLLLSLLSVSGALPKDTPEHPRLPLTAGWAHIDGRDHGDFSVYRKYSFLIDSTDNPIRNVFMLNCSPNQAAYLTIVIPKELSLEQIYGKKNFKNKEFMIVTTSYSGDTSKYQAVAEIKENEIYFDFIGQQRSAVDSMLKAKAIKFLLHGDQFPIEFIDLGEDLALPLDDNKVSFDKLVSTMLDRSGQKARYLRTKAVINACPDVAHWNDH